MIVVLVLSMIDSSLVLYFQSKSLMIIGIDSYHDKKRKQVSVAAFVATTNPQCTSYYSRIIMQTTTQELVDGISVCIRGRFERCVLL